jgi:hypothetical protein
MLRFIVKNYFKNTSTVWPPQTSPKVRQKENIKRKEGRQKTQKIISFAFPDAFR